MVGTYVRTLEWHAHGGLGEAVSRVSAIVSYEVFMKETDVCIVLRRVRFHTPVPTLLYICSFDHIKNMKNVQKTGKKAMETL